MLGLVGRVVVGLLVETMRGGIRRGGTGRAVRMGTAVWRVAPERGAGIVVSAAALSGRAGKDDADYYGGDNKEG